MIVVSVQVGSGKSSLVRSHLTGDLRARVMRNTQGKMDQCHMGSQGRVSGRRACLLSMRNNTKVSVGAVE